MSTVQRSVYLNPIEPAVLSFKTPAQMETWLDVNFFDERGQPYNTDLGAQLHLTARSTDHNVTYAMPATDMVNGKARAIIPAGDLQDMNGYRLRIFGTWKQRPWLLAMGNLSLITGAGVDAQPDDVIDQIGLTFARGIDDYVDVKLWHDAAKTNPFDVSSVTVTAPILSAPAGGTLDSFAIAVIALNEVRLSLTIAQTDALPASSWWKLIVSSGAGQQTMAEGRLTMTG